MKYIHDSKPDAKHQGFLRRMWACSKFQWEKGKITAKAWQESCAPNDVFGLELSGDEEQEKHPITFNQCISANQGEEHDCEYCGEKGQNENVLWIKHVYIWHLNETKYIMLAWQN